MRVFHTPISPPPLPTPASHCPACVCVPTQLQRVVLAINGSKETIQASRRVSGAGVAALWGTGCPSDTPAPPVVVLVTFLCPLLPPTFPPPPPPLPPRMRGSGSQPRRSFKCWCHFAFQEGKDWIARHADSAAGIAAVCRGCIVGAETFVAKLYLLYLVNDVLFHAITPGLVSERAIAYRGLLLPAAGPATPPRASPSTLLPR
jgi:hypothetical protein